MDTSFLLKVCEAVLPVLHEVNVFPSGQDFVIDGIKYQSPDVEQDAVLYLRNSCYVIPVSSLRHLKMWILEIALGKTETDESWFPITVWRDGARYDCLAHLILDLSSSTETDLHFACTIDARPVTNGMDFLAMDRKHLSVDIYRNGEHKKKSIPSLSEREWKCVYLAEAGMTTAEICRTLCWSESKTKHTKVGIYKKLGVNDMVQAVTVLRMLNIRAIVP